MLDTFYTLLLNLIANPEVTASSFIAGFIVGWFAKKILGKYDYIQAECLTDNNHRINYTSIRQFNKEKNVMCPKLRHDLVCVESGKPCHRVKR